MCFPPIFIGSGVSFGCPIVQGTGIGKFLSWKRLPASYLQKGIALAYQGRHEAVCCVSPAVHWSVAAVHLILILCASHLVCQPHGHEPLYVGVLVMASYAVFLTSTYCTLKGFDFWLPTLTLNYFESESLTDWDFIRTVIKKSPESALWFQKDPPDLKILMPTITNNSVYL